MASTKFELIMETFGLCRYDDLQLNTLSVDVPLTYFTNTFDFLRLGYFDGYCAELERMEYISKRCSHLNHRFKNDSCTFISFIINALEFTQDEDNSFEIKYDQIADGAVGGMRTKDNKNCAPHSICDEISDLICNGICQALSPFTMLERLFVAICSFNAQYKQGYKNCTNENIQDTYTAIFCYGNQILWNAHLVRQPTAFRNLNEISESLRRWL
eukprot:218000_1